MGSGRPDLGSDRPDWGSERPILRPRRLFSRLGGGGQTDGRTETGKFALCGIIGHRPLRGRCPKSEFFRPFGYFGQIIWALLR